MIGEARALMSHRRAGRLLFALLAVVAGAILIACDDGDGPEATGQGGSIEVDNARAQFTTTDLGAVYFDIRSTGTGDVLVGASAAIAGDAQVHEVVIEGSSAMMRQIEDGIPIDPGGHVSLQPGGYHVMLLGVEEIPEVGSTFEVVLDFERAGPVTITVHVQEFGAGDGGRDHGGMEESGMDGEEMDGEEQGSE